MATKRRPIADAPPGFLQSIITPSTHGLTSSALTRIFQKAGDLHAELQQQVKRSLSLAIAIGDLLIQARAATPWGAWEAVFEREFCSRFMIGKRTAERYILLAEKKDHLFKTLEQENSGLVSVNQSDLCTKLSINEALRRLQFLGKQDQASSAIRVSKNDWVIPRSVASLVTGFLSSVDVDVAGLQGQNPVGALNVITPSEDSLQTKTPWGKRVWVNPGVKGVQFESWIEAVIGRFKTGEIDLALLLLPATTNAPWFRLLSGYPKAFLKDPLTVLRPPMLKASVEHTPMMFTFYGSIESKERFVKVFESVSEVYLSTHIQ